MYKFITFLAAASFAAVPVLADNVLATYTAEPADGSVLTEFKEVNVVFTQAESISPSFGVSSTLTLPDGETVGSFGWQQTNYEGKWIGYTVMWQDTYTQKGEYTVTIPEGALSCGEEKSSEIVLHYTVGAAEDEELPETFADGIFMLNEDWFGHASSSMNFIDGDRNVYYDVYKAVNAGRSLGNTSQFGTIYGDHIYVTSKQNYNGDGRQGGRFTAMNAFTLEYEGGIDQLPCGDGRGFCAVSDEKGYIGGESGFYAINLEKIEVYGEQLAPESSRGYTQSGDMLRYGDRVFVAQQSVGVVVVDINTDTTTVIELPKICGFAVTPDGTLYAACSDANAEFVAINPVTLATETIDIEGSHAIDDNWGTWRPASIAADKSRNVVYYISGGGWTPTKISAYDFDSKKFTEAFVTVPDNQTIYGTGMSVDPVSGDIIVACTQKGWGTNYSYNWIYFADPSDGNIQEDKTITLREYYWFPAMMLYNNFSAPELTAEEVTLVKDAETTIDLSEITALSAGNVHLVIYDMESSDDSIVSVTVDGDKAVLEGKSVGEATLSLTAEYQGRIASIDIPASVTVSTGVEFETVDAAAVDVYNVTGVCVLRGATPSQIRNLAPGVYIAGGKKYVVK